MLLAKTFLLLFLSYLSSSTNPDIDIDGMMCANQFKRKGMGGQGRVGESDNAATADHRTA